MRTDQVLSAYRDFFEGRRRELDPVGFFHEVVASVPAYRDFLAEAHVDPATVRSVESFHRRPMTTKDTYHRRYPLPHLCREGRLGACDMVAVSSGSSGTPTIWPRSLADELHITERFEQVFRTFGADTRSTLAVVFFPLGTWVGGLFTTACVRHLAAKGFPVTTVAPGNNKVEILRVHTRYALPHARVAPDSAGCVGADRSRDPPALSKSRSAPIDRGRGGSGHTGSPADCSRWPSHRAGRCCIVGSGDALDLGFWPGSDRAGEFGERRGNPQSGWDVKSEFVVTASKVLHEGVPGDDHLGCPISLSPAHRP